MYERKSGLIADGVVAPDFGDVDRILGGEASGHVDAPGWDVQMEGCSCTAEVSPLSHGFQVIDRFRGFDLDRSHQLFAVARGQHKIRKDLDLPDSHRHGLVFPDIGGHFMPPLQSNLQKPDHTVVLELLTDRAHQNRAHLTSGTRQ